MVWNHCPYWGSFLSTNNSWTGCMSALGVLKQLGYFVPVWSWLFWTPLSLKHSGLWKSLACTFLCSKQGCPPFLAKQFPSPQNRPQSSYTHFFGVHVWSLDWKGEKRDTEIVCVCTVSTHSQEIVSDKEESGEDKYHMILLICDILKNELIYKTDRKRMTLQLPVRGMVAGGRDRLAAWVWHIRMAVFKMDDQQGPTVQHRELGLIFCNCLSGKRLWKAIDAYITESPCSTPETNSSLITYTPL